MESKPDLEADEERTYRHMVDALIRQDVRSLEELLTDDVEIRSYSTGLELVAGRPAVEAALKANAHLLYDPTLSGFEHLGDGWMIVSARIRHSILGGGIADSAKALLVRVLDARVQLSLVFNTRAEVEAEYLRRTADDA